MCGPVDRCCCCYPAHIGVRLKLNSIDNKIMKLTIRNEILTHLNVARFIAAFCTILELGGVIYNTIILAENNQSFILTIGHDMPNYKAYMAGIICGYIVIIAANLILIYGSMKDNRSPIDEMIKSNVLPDGFLFPGCSWTWSLWLPASSEPSPSLSGSPLSSQSLSLPFSPRRHLFAELFCFTGNHYWM